MTAQRDPERNEQKALKRFVSFKDRSVLEIGCGDGRMTWEYAGEAGRVIGIDPDRSELRIARSDQSYKLDGKVFFAGAGARWLPFPKEKFDIAILAWSL